MARTDEEEKAFEAYQAAHERALKAELRQLAAARAEKAANEEEAKARKAEQAAYQRWISFSRKACGETEAG